jgi:hypothetical protein
MVLNSGLILIILVNVILLWIYFRTNDSGGIVLHCLTLWCLIPGIAIMKCADQSPEFWVLTTTVDALLLCSSLLNSGLLHITQDI